MRPPKNDDEAEWNKTMLTVLPLSPAIVIYDDATEPIGNGVTQALGTSRRYRGRLLGANKMGEYDNNCIHVVTGKNAAYPKGDQERRSFYARADIGEARPDMRIFTRDPLVEAIRDRRAILTDVLTLVRRYTALGRPKAAHPVFASFTEWADIMAGVLACTGIPDFLMNREAFRANANPANSQWADFLKAIADWQHQGKHAGFKAGQLTPMVHEKETAIFLGYKFADGALESAAPPFLQKLSGSKALLTVLGKALRNEVDVPHDGLVLRVMGSAGGSQTYTVQEIAPPGSEGSEGITHNSICAHTHMSTQGEGTSLPSLPSLHQREPLEGPSRRPSLGMGYPHSLPVRKSLPVLELAKDAGGVPLPACAPRPDWPCPQCGTSTWLRVKHEQWYCSTCEAGYGPPPPDAQTPIE